VFDIIRILPNEVICYVNETLNV